MIRNNLFTGCRKMRQPPCFYKIFTPPERILTGGKGNGYG